LQNLKKNTEQLGSIFDAQPSELQGNIHCVTDPSEPVLGYIGVTNIQQKRIFISKNQLPDTWLVNYPYQCELDTFLFNRNNLNEVAEFLIPLNSSDLPVTAIYSKGGAIVGYTGSDRECSDCTIRGADQPPPFWR